MSKQLVLDWLNRGGEVYEMHMRAELAKTHGYEVAFSDAYQPRRNPSLTAKAA